MSWPSVKLGEIFNITSSKRVHEKDWRTKGVPFYRAREVVALSKEGKVDNDLFIDESMYEEYKSKYGVPKEGDLLVTAVGTLGKTYAVKKEDRFYFKDASVIWLSKKANVDTSYIQHAINSTEVQRYIQNSSGATVGTYTISRANETEIPLPPLEEQKRIAAILDKADAIRRKRQEAIKLADEFLRAVFLDMFGDPVTNPKGWKVKTIGELCTIVRGSSPRPQGDPKYYGGPIPRLMVADLTRDGKWVTPKIDSLTLEGAKKSRPINAGTVVMAVSGNVGLTAILEIDACIHDGFIAFNNLKTEAVESEFLYELMMFLKSTHASRQAGAIFQNITTSQIKEMAIPLPSIELQKSYLNYVHRLKVFTENQYKFLAKDNDLFCSLSNKAFSGDSN